MRHPVGASAWRGWPTELQYHDRTTMPPQPPEVATPLFPPRLGPECEQRASMKAGFSLAIQAAGSKIGVSNKSDRD
jgi:hypothetical protein